MFHCRQGHLKLQAARLADREPGQLAVRDPGPAKSPPLLPVVMWWVVVPQLELAQGAWEVLGEQHSVEHPLGCLEFERWVVQVWHALGHPSQGH